MLQKGEPSVIGAETNGAHCAPVPITSFERISDKASTRKRSHVSLNLQSRFWRLAEADEYSRLLEILTRAEEGGKERDRRRLDRGRRQSLAQR